MYWIVHLLGLVRNFKFVPMHVKLSYTLKFLLKLNYNAYLISNEYSML